MARNSTRTLTLSAMLVAIMLILGYVERTLAPLLGLAYGIKLGLSNSVLLLGIYWLGIPVALVLMVLKVFLSGFLFSTGIAMAYSFAGGALSMLAMSLLYLGFCRIGTVAPKVEKAGPIVVGCVGGAMHNVGQVLAAMLVLQDNIRLNPNIGKVLLAQMGYLVLIGAAMGVATGTVAKLMMVRLPANLRPQPRQKKDPPRQRKNLQ